MPQGQGSVRQGRQLHRSRWRSGDRYEFTGRVMPGRRWSDGQHQAIEAEEALPIQAETRTLRPSPPEFLLYLRLAGMTGTAKTEEVEFEKTYKLETTIVPTVVRARQDWADQVYKQAAKWQAVANETADIHKNSRPCWWVPPPLKRANCSVPFCLTGDSPQPAQRQAGER